MGGGRVRGDGSGEGSVRGGGGGNAFRGLENEENKEPKTKGESNTKMLFGVKSEEEKDSERGKATRKRFWGFKKKKTSPASFRSLSEHPL